MSHRTRLLWRWVAPLVISLGWVSVSRSQSATPTPTPTPTPAARQAVPSATPTPTPTPVIPGPRYLATYRPCQEAVLGIESSLDATRRRLYQTLCGASLWLDSLFGRHGSVAAAEEANGRAELSVLRSNVEGTKVKTGLDTNITLPHLEEKLHAFLGRADKEDYVRDRQEGFGLRSQFVSLESEEKWLAGLGYSLPGSFDERANFRVGVTGGRQPTVFGQGVYQRNVSFGDRDLWRLREVGFWRNREGFGFTSSADYDHVVSNTMLLRWGTVGTVAQGSSGLDWRSALVLYQNLHQTRAVAYEAFLRGVTVSGVGLSESGARIVYRQSVFRPWFFGEALLGYSWLRQDPGQPLKGSIVFGLGSELVFGPLD